MPLKIPMSGAGMNKIVILLTMLAFSGANQSSAAPQLSQDGSLLSGVDVGGTLYNVRFGDGIVEEVYGGIVFDDARREESLAVSQAIATSLMELSPVPRLYNIAGCERGGLWVGVPSCLLFLPDTVDFVGSVLYHDYAEVQGTAETPDGVPVWIENPGGHFISPNYASTHPAITLVTYEIAPPASVPASTSIPLVSLGLAVLGIIHLARHRRQEVDGSSRRKPQKIRKP
jgi:hypothetical protein